MRDKTLIKRTLRRLGDLLSGDHGLTVDVDTNQIDAWDASDEPSTGATLIVDYDPALDEWHVSVTQGRKYYGVGPFGPDTSVWTLYREAMGAARRESDLLPEITR